MDLNTISLLWTHKHTQQDTLEMHHSYYSTLEMSQTTYLIYCICYTDISVDTSQKTQPFHYIDHTMDSSQTTQLIYCICHIDISPQWTRPKLYTFTHSVGHINTITHKYGHVLNQTLIKQLLPI